VESGRLDPGTGSMKAWPWTIDANGTGTMYDSAQSAIQAASAFEAAGITSLDISCLQVNLAQHPDAFQSLAQAFDPAANADYAAGFLTSLEQKFGNWP
jgi:soluble lytic murein transglycosylase-like protein